VVVVYIDTYVGFVPDWLNEAQRLMTSRGNYLFLPSFIERERERDEGETLSLSLKTFFREL